MSAAGRRSRGRRRRSLADVAARNPRAIYDWMYRRGAPWEGGPRRELVDLVTSGDITPSTTGPRAIDIGCGSGANSVFLAQHGFRVVGVDISPVAIGKAKEAAARAGADPAFRVADLTDLPADLGGPFDLLVDYGTIDDFPPGKRPAVVETVTALARPGSVLVMWCFYALDADLPRFSLQGASRWGAPGIEPDELEELFAPTWAIEPVSGGADQGFGCFRMTRLPFSS